MRAVFLKTPGGPRLRRAATAAAFNENETITTSFVAAPSGTERRIAQTAAARAAVMPKYAIKKDWSTVGLTNCQTNTTHSTVNRTTATTARVDIATLLPLNATLPVHLGLWQ